MDGNRRTILEKAISMAQNLTRIEVEAIKVPMEKTYSKIDIIALARETLPKGMKKRSAKEIRQILLDMHDLVQGV